MLLCSFVLILFFLFFFLVCMYSLELEHTRLRSLLLTPVKPQKQYKSQTSRSSNSSSSSSLTEQHLNMLNNSK